MEKSEAVEVVDLVSILLDKDENVYSAFVGGLHECCIGENHGRHGELAVDCGKGVEIMQIGRILASLALLYPYRMAGMAPDPERFVRGTIDGKFVENHINRTIEELSDHVEPESLSLSVSASLSYLADLSCAIAGRVGTTVSIRGLLDTAKRDPVIAKLISWKAPDGELGVIEKEADAAASELATRLAALPGEYGRLLRCGAAVNKDQMRQAFVSIGVKPGLMDGELMSEPVDTNFLRGMRNVEDYYICAVGARKALTTNYKQVKNSGYLSRKLVLLTANQLIDPVLTDCGTRHGVRTLVQTEDHARRLVGRTIGVQGGGWSAAPLTEEAALSLVGKEIVLRSPITCSGENVCHACYGALARTNSNIHAGIYGVLVISEQIIQRLLSSKHLLKARPTKINWPEEFQKHFTVERASVIAESSVERVYVKVDDIELDEDEERRTSSIFYYRVAGKNGRLKLISPVPLYLDEDAWESTEIDDGEVAITPVQETSIFHVPVTNTDLSEALHSVFNLIEREELVSYHDAYSKLIGLLGRSEIKAPSVHAEMILRAMVRSVEDNMQRPDFSGPDEPAYAILKLTQAILASSSVTTSLSFERVKNQLTSVEVLKKSASGVMDSLFGGG